MAVSEKFNLIKYLNNNFKLILSDIIIFENIYNTLVVIIMVTF